MLEAKKNHWFEKIFAVYNRNFLKRRFNALKVSGLGFLRDSALEFPLIIYANHSSWWDGLVAFQISKTAHLDSFIMMEEKHLKRLFLFQRLGAFSVIRENRFAADQSINYAVKLLTEKQNRALWIFPQGEILPNDSRPIKFYSGISKIIQKIDGIYALPIAMRYEFTSVFKPEGFVKIGKPVFINGSNISSRKKLTQNLEEILTKTLDELHTNTVNKEFADFKNII